MMNKEVETDAEDQVEYMGGGVERSRQTRRRPAPMLINYWRLKHQQWMTTQAQLKIPLSASEQQGGLAAIQAGYASFLVTFRQYSGSNIFIIIVDLDPLIHNSEY